jgi:hypothetical protein
MSVALIVTVILTILTVLIHYEVLRFTEAALPRLAIPPRSRLIFVLFTIFLAHAFEIWIFSLSFYAGSSFLNIGGIGGEMTNTYFDYLYLSISSYTSLGLGDVFPTGNLRLISSFESLVGLLMIGWSSSFTYLTMREFWPMHVSRRRAAKQGG